MTIEGRSDQFLPIALFPWIRDLKFEKSQIALDSG
jgi:hypothetical protein